jgi:hypothetical protein
MAYFPFFSGRIIAMLCAVAIAMQCQPQAKTTDRTAVSTSADSLKTYVEIPGSVQATWFILARGNQKTRSVPGPTDYELYALVECKSQEFIAQLKNECAPVDLDEGLLPVDTACAQVIGLLAANRKAIVGDKVYLKGTALDIGKMVRRPLSGGIGLIMGSTVLLIANTM